MAAYSKAGTIATVTPEPGYTNLWTDTGVPLTAGQSVEITATGLWSWGVGYMFGPDGDPTYGPDSDDWTPGQKGALVGFIGVNPFTAYPGNPSGPYFVVGSSDSFIAGLSGELWLGFNDDAASGATFDNQGSVTADINTPEPSAMILLGSGLLGLSFVHFKRSKRSGK
jgi:hypothetical protein